MKADQFQGVFPYLVSPIDRQGNVMAEVLGRLVDHLVRTGVHGLTPLGSTGEFAYLDWEQRRRVVEIVLEANAGRVPVVAGVAATTTAEAVRQARAFEQMGVDGILAIMEAYFPVSETGMIRYFSEIAHAVSCPLTLYTNPNFQRVDLTLGAIEKLSEISNIKYVKDASSDTGRLLSIINRVGDRMKVFSASAHIPLCVLLIGGVGWMAGPACIIPAQSVRLYDLATGKKWEEAMILQRDLWGINQVFAKYSLAACIKTGLALQGFEVGDPLPPQEPLSPKAQEEIRQALIKVGGLHPNVS